MNFKFSEDMLIKFTNKTLQKICRDMGYIFIRGLGLGKFNKEQLIRLILLGQHTLYELKKMGRDMKFKSVSLKKKQLVMRIFKVKDKEIKDNNSRLRRNERERKRRYWNSIKKKHEEVRKSMKLVISGAFI